MAIEYYSLLLKFNSLPELKTNTTIFDITGYPHYENVCSNVLAFYFDPQGIHGLSDLLWQSFLNAAKQSCFGECTNLNIFREYKTSEGGRLDILIESDTHVIGIENKIFHHLNNNLDDYMNTIELKCENRLIPVGIVLSLNPIQLTKESKFINITYNNLWQLVKYNIGQYIDKSDKKWLSFLLDFIDNTESLAGPSMEFSERDKFLIDNQTVINKLTQENNLLHSKLNNQVSSLCDILNQEKYEPIGFSSRWIYKSTCLVHDFIISNHKVAFDLHITFNGWKLSIFDRDTDDNSFINLLITDHSKKQKSSDNRIILELIPITTSLEQVKNKICSLIDLCVKTDANKLLRDADAPHN